MRTRDLEAPGLEALETLLRRGVERGRGTARHLAGPGRLARPGGCGHAQQQLHLAAQHRRVAPESDWCTEEMAAAAALAASDVRKNRDTPRPRAEVEAEVARLRLA